MQADAHVFIIRRLSDLAEPIAAFVLKKGKKTIKKHAQQEKLSMAEKGLVPSLSLASFRFIIL